MATQTYKYEGYRNKNNPTQQQTRRYLVDDSGNRIGPIETLAGSPEQYQAGGTVVTCVQDTTPVFMAVVVQNELQSNAYVELRPTGNCNGNSLYATGFGMPPGSTVAMQPSSVEKKPYCLYLNTPGQRSRLVDENNKVILSSDGVTAGTLANHVPLERYKIVVGVAVVSFTFTNELPVAATILIKDCRTGEIKAQTPANGVAAGGVFVFPNMDADELCLEFIATGMTGRGKRAQLLNSNGFLLTSTDGTSAGRFPAFKPGSNLRAVVEGNTALNDLRVTSATNSRYGSGGSQEVQIFLSSAEINNIGPFSFYIQNANNLAEIAKAERVNYDNTNGYVLTLATPFNGQVYVKAVAHRGDLDASNDWTGIDYPLTLFNNDQQYISKVAFRYDGVETQTGRQLASLLVNTTFASPTAKWDGYGLPWGDLMIPTTDYPGYTHYLRLFGEIGRATFDFQNVFNISPKSPANDMVTVTYTRGTDAPGTTRVLYEPTNSSLGEWSADGEPFYIY